MMLRWKVPHSNDIGEPHQGFQIRSVERAGHLCRCHRKGHRRP